MNITCSSNFFFASLSGILLAGYAPLGSPDNPWKRETIPNLLLDGNVTTIARRHAKTPAQILIRFALQRGMIVIVKSTNPVRIRQNRDVLDFALEPEEMETLMSMDMPHGRGRGFDLDFLKDTPYYPFNDEY